MGRAKDAYIEMQERGWAEVDKHVCAKCVHDSYLASLVAESASHTGCAYCRARDVPSAEVNCILEAVNIAIHYAYNDEANAGVPYDKEMLVECLSSRDVLEATLSHADVIWCDGLMADVANAFSDTCWVEAPQGDFWGSFEHQRYRWSWEAFTKTVKHQSRFHFHVGAEADEHGDEPIGPAQMLGFLGRVFQSNNMVKTVAADTVLYRVRRGAWPLVAQEAGSPPHGKAVAGRMNPAGIPYLYLAFDQHTALAEARAVVAESVTLSQWQPSRELRVLDLSHKPQCGSIFEGQDSGQDEVIFLRHFVEDIRKPLGKDDIPEIEYVPTQLVCEYLAQIFTSEDFHLDGLIYPSALTSGVNLVLFPVSAVRYAEPSLNRFEMVTFQSAKLVKAWNEPT